MNLNRQQTLLFAIVIGAIAATIVVVGLVLAAVQGNWAFFWGTLVACVGTVGLGLVAVSIIRTSLANRLPKSISRARMLQSRYPQALVLNAFDLRLDLPDGTHPAIGRVSPWDYVALVVTEGRVEIWHRGVLVTELPTVTTVRRADGGRASVPTGDGRQLSFQLADAGDALGL